MYIDALSNEAGYRAIMAKYPDDLEAKAFEVWRIWHKDEDITPPLAELGHALRLARDILRVAPMHPIHHAVIHIADATNRPQDGLDSALKCGPSAPSIGHMWHMPTHLYYALARGSEAAWCMEASIRTEHARMMHDRVLPDQVALYAHNNEWLVRMLLLLGRVREARQIASQMIDLPRHPLYNMLESPKKPESHGEESHDDTKPVESDDSSAYYGRRRYLDSLRRFEYWDDLIDACQSGYIELAGPLDEQGDVHVNLGIAHYARGEVAKGDRELELLRRLFSEERAQRGASLAAVRKIPPGDRVRAVSAVARRFDDPLAHLQTSLVALESYHRLASGFFLTRTELVASLGIVLAFEVALLWLTRRRIRLALLTVVPALAVCGWLIHAHWALINLPDTLTDVDLAYLSRSLLEAGEPGSAERCASRVCRGRSGERPDAGEPGRGPLPGGQAGRGTPRVRCPAEPGRNGRSRFVPLRSPGADRPRIRLSDRLAAAGGDSEVIGRPSAAPVAGPAHVAPWTAPDWKLKDAAGVERSLADFHRQPVLLVFFLGRGCLHCKEQLEAFVKRERQITEAGLKLIAVSSDNQAGIKGSLADYGPARFPFLMVADPELKTFQAYRAYDSFEQIALHATFLIDGAGLCRWQDVGFEPFRDVDFVLAESKRLLARPVAPLEAGARVIPN